MCPTHTRHWTLNITRWPLAQLCQVKALQLSKKLAAKSRSAIIAACDQGLLLGNEVNQSLLGDVMEVSKRREQLDRDHANKAAMRAAVTARVVRVELQNMRLFLDPHVTAADHATVRRIAREYSMDVVGDLVGSEVFLVSDLTRISDVAHWAAVLLGKRIVTPAWLQSAGIHASCGSLLNVPLRFLLLPM